MLSLNLLTQRCLRGTSLGFCLSVIVNEKPLTFENTTYNVYLLLLINLC